MIHCVRVSVSFRIKQKFHSMDDSYDVGIFLFILGASISVMLLFAKKDGGVLSGISELTLPVV